MVVEPRSPKRWGHRCNIEVARKCLEPRPLSSTFSLDLSHAGYCCECFPHPSLHASSAYPFSHEQGAFCLCAQLHRSLKAKALQADTGLPPCQAFVSTQEWSRCCCEIANGRSGHVALARECIVFSGLKTTTARRGSKFRVTAPRRSGEYEWADCGGMLTGV